jgi:hypothetical protein
VRSTLRHSRRPCSSRQNVIGRALGQLALRIAPAHGLEPKVGRVEKALDVFGPAQLDGGCLRPAAGVVDLDLSVLGRGAEDSNRRVLGLEQPVRVHQLHCDPAAAVSRCTRQGLGACQNARRADHEWEAPIEVQILDPGLQHYSPRQPRSQALKHAWMDVYADQVDARRCKRYGQAPGAHA